MMTLIIPRKEAPVSGEGTVVIPQPAGDESVIKNTFFFPDIHLKRVRQRMRLEQTVAPARLREAIKSGMAETNAVAVRVPRTENCRRFLRVWRTSRWTTSTVKASKFFTTSAP